MKILIQHSPQILDERKVISSILKSTHQKYDDNEMGCTAGGVVIYLEALKTSSLLQMFTSHVN